MWVIFFFQINFDGLEEFSGLDLDKNQKHFLKNQKLHVGFKNVITENTFLKISLLSSQLTFWEDFGNLQFKCVLFLNILEVR
jgi:hypothetical protein